MLISTIAHTIELLKETYRFKSNSYGEYNDDSNEKDPKFKVDDLK